MPRIRFRTFDKGLILTSAPDETPLNALRRARNVAPLLKGMIKAAPPFVLVEDPGVASQIQSITRFDGKLFAGFANGNFRRNGPPWAAVTLPAGYTTHAAITLSGSFLTYVKASPTDQVFEQLFVVDQGGTGDHLFKVNASGVATRWGIHPLTQANVNSANLVAEPQDEKFIHSAASDPIEAAGDWTLASADEDALDAGTTLATEATIAVQGNSLKLTVARDNSAQITRAYGANIDLTTFGAVASTDEDFIQFWVRVRRPSRIENFEIAFDTTAAGDFADTYFSREITFKQVNRRKKAELIALGDLVEVGKEQEFLQERFGRPDDLTFDGELGNQQISVAKNTWTRVTLPKSSFEKVGTPTWSTVRAIRFTCAANKEGRTAVFIDRLTLNGGVGMLGRYKYTFTLRNSATGTRSNPFITDEGEIVNESPLGSGGDPAMIERQAVSILFPLADIFFDPQVDQFEVWRTFGNGEVYFKVGHITLTTPGRLVSGTEIIDRTADYVGLIRGAADYTLATSSGTFSGNAFLDPSLELPLDNDTPNAPEFMFRDAVGPHYGRIWWFNNQAAAGGSGNGYYSPIGRAEAVSAFIQITSGESDALAKGIIWNDRLFVLSAEALFEIVGTDEPFIARKIEGAPGTFFPNSVVAATPGIFYLAFDGVYYFDGISAVNITDGTLFPIFHAREAIEDFAATSIPAIATTGRNALWLGGGIGSQFTYVFDFDTRSWRYREPVSALYYDHTTGRVLGGFSASAPLSDIYNIEPFPFDTAGTAYILDVKTAEARFGPGVKGILRKLYVDIDSQSEAAITVEVFLDGTAVSLGLLSAASGRRVVEFNVNRQAERFAVRISSTASINTNIQLYGIELDVYVPGTALPDIGS